MTVEAISARDPRYRGLLASRPWSLCIGAGASFGLFPSWSGFASQVLSECAGEVVEPTKFDSLVALTGWGFHAWIQVGMNWLVQRGRDPSEFNGIVERALYTQLLSDAKREGIEKELIWAFNSTQRLKREQVIRVFDFLKSRGNTAMQLASALLEASEAKKSPHSVITLNYDTVIETLIRLLQVIRRNEIVGKFEFPAQRYHRRVGPLAGAGDAVSIEHIHGCVTPQPILRRRYVPYDSRDRVIGTEDSYLDLEGVNYSWPQTTFLGLAQSTSIAFVGVSMSDPNIRRWLSWASRVRHSELTRIGKGGKQSPHFWIHKRPADAISKNMLELSLVHLGVRVAWIDDWSEVKHALDNLLAIDKI